MSYFRTEESHDNGREMDVKFEDEKDGYERYEVHMLNIRGLCDKSSEVRKRMTKEKDYTVPS